MNYRARFLMFTFGLMTVMASGQTNFRAGWEMTNPVPPESRLSLEEKVKAHQHLLDQATAENNTLKRLYGILYIFYDYLRAHDYTEATRYLLEAETLAKASGNPGWQGWVAHRKGVLAVHLKQYREAIVPYEASLTLCSEAKDSLCMGECLEQLSAMHARIDEFGKAHEYFKLALPLIEKHGSPSQLANTLNNYGNMLSMEERPAEAIPYFERAILVNEKTGDQQRAAQFLSNLADPYCQLRRFDQALDIYRQCMNINRKNNWTENLVFNYAGISEVCKQMGNFSAALDFFQQYHMLRDSLVGAETQEKIAELETLYNTQQKELELQKSQVELGTARNQLERGALLLVLVVLTAAFGLWRWRLQTRQAEQERLQNQENLGTMARLLLEKNALITTLEMQVSERSPANGMVSDPADFEENLFSQRILTEEDWSAFKIYFEKAYPGYLLRLRTAFNTLSDAEERLFLFLKLNLTTKEAATILGISADSVKKTRHRLRKRLELAEEVDLDAYIRNF